MATARELQQAINRFANDPFVGFDPIACDGDPGKHTLGAAILALNAINLSDPDPSRVDNAALLIDALNDLTTASKIMQFSDQLMPLLTASANALGYGAGACGVIGATKAVVPRTQQAKAIADRAKLTNKALSAGILGLGLPDWAVIGGGAALLIAVAMLIKTKKAGASSAVTVSGRRY